VSGVGVWLMTCDFPLSTLDKVGRSTANS
jgi:hypothetical protein